MDLNAGMQLVTFMHKCQGAYLPPFPTLVVIDRGKRYVSIPQLLLINNSETEVYWECVTNIDR